MAKNNNNGFENYDETRGDKLIPIFKLQIDYLKVKSLRDTGDESQFVDTLYKIIEKDMQSNPDILYGFWNYAYDVADFPGIKEIDEVL